MKPSVISKVFLFVALAIGLGVPVAAMPGKTGPAKDVSGLPDPGMLIDIGSTALVVTDPQNDFLSEKGVTWGVVGESVNENNTVSNIEALLKAAKKKGLPVFVSPHYYYPTDKGWKFEGALEVLMHKIGMFDRKSALSADGFEGSGADWLARYKPLIEDGETVVASPHKVYGPEANDLALQLRKHKIDKVILAGMSANLCVEAHMRELLENGFEVAVVTDGTAAAKVPGYDGYKAALTNFRFMASDLLTTEEAIEAIEGAAPAGGGSTSSGRIGDKPKKGDKSPLPTPGIVIDKTHTALVVTDPQNDFLSEQGVTWGVVGESVKENDTVANIEALLKAAKKKEIPVFVSPHYYYPTDKGWKFEGALEVLMHKIGMFDRKGALTTDGFEGSGADWLARYKPLIADGKTVVANPHKVYGPEANDLALQLRKHKIDKVILAGMSANLCVEAHMRELIENGFEVAVVSDGTAAAKVPGHDGYEAAMTNFRFIASAVLTTDEVVKAFGEAK